jgi:hypothetical protein
VSGDVWVSNYAVCGGICGKLDCLGRKTIGAAFIGVHFPPCKLTRILACSRRQARRQSTVLRLKPNYLRQ